MIKPVYSKKYLMIVLCLLASVGMIEYIQSESLSYVVGFKGQGLLAGNPKFEMQAAYPNILAYYGVISSIDSLFNTFGIFLGPAIDKFNRKNLLGGMVALSSLAMIVTGSVHSLIVLCFMRMILGITHSAFMPGIFSLI